MKVPRLAFLYAAGVHAARVCAAGAYAASVAALGCGGDGGPRYGAADNPTTVRDVSGAVFGWNCNASGCDLATLLETPPADPCGGGERAGFSYSWGRFFDVCSVCVSTNGSYWSTTSGQCRILACDTDADCPIVYAYSPTDVYECVNGACENADQMRRPRTPLVRTNAEELCFAPYPRAETSNPFGAIPMQVEADLDANCTGNYPMDTCTLPAGCRAP